MTLEATAQESSNGDTAVFSRNFTVNVAGVPDQLTVNAAPATIQINEDTQTGVNAISTAFNLQCPDNDGSQTMSVVISGFRPARPSS